MSGCHFGPLVFQKEKPETDKPEFLESFWWFLPEAIKPRKNKAQTPSPGPQNSIIWPHISIPACSPTLHVLALWDAARQGYSHFLSMVCAFSPLHLCFFFLIIYFKVISTTQHAAQTHDPGIKSCMLSWLSQLGTPAPLLFTIPPARNTIFPFSLAAPTISA